MKAIERLSGFNDYLSHISHNPKSSGDLWHNYDFLVKDSHVAITSFNNSWRASGEADSIDRNHLLLGERTVDNAISALPDCDLKIALYHHPLSWLADFDATCVEPRLYQNYDILTFGHLHNPRPEATRTIAGSSVLLQAGSLYATRKHFNGYHIISVDPLTGEIDLTLRTYFNEPLRRFGAAESLAEQGKAVFSYSPKKKSLRPDLEKLLRVVRSSIRAQALEQFNISDLSAVHNGDPHSAFVTPPLQTKYALGAGADDPKHDFDNATDGSLEGDSLSEDNSDDTSIDDSNTFKPLDEGKPISLTDVLSSEKNILFVGPREVGKTSLAHYCAVLISEGATLKQRIPVLLDAKGFKNSLYYISRSANSYLGAANASIDMDRYLDDGSLIFLIDNFTGLDEAAKLEIEDAIKAYKNVRWLLFADERFGGLNPKAKGNDLIKGIVPVTISHLPRKSIRELTQRWCSLAGSDEEETYNKLMGQIRGADLPKNGYIVTLLLWAMHAEKNLERINESVLIMNMVDYLLGKANFSNILRRDLDAIGKEIVLSSVARFLKDKGGVASANDVNEHLIKFFRSKSLSCDAGDVVSTLSTCGILVKIEGNIRFKYRCFQEYFVAKYLTSSPSRIVEVFEGENPLDYARELEIASGLMRENEDLIFKVINHITQRPPSAINHVDITDFDRFSSPEDAVFQTRGKLEQIRKKKITKEQIDELWDIADAKLSDRKEADQSNSPSKLEDDVSAFEKENKSTVKFAEDNLLTLSDFKSGLDLLGKILKNSDFTDGATKVEASRDYLRYIVIFYMTVVKIFNQTLESFIKELGDRKSALTDEDIKSIKYLFAVKIFGYCSLNVSETISSPKLIGTFSSVLQEPAISNAEKFLATVLQLDNGDPKWSQGWKTFIEDSKYNRFILDLFTENLYNYTRLKTAALSKMEAVEDVASSLQGAIGSGNQKQHVINNAAALARKEGLDGRKRRRSKSRRIKK